jgi:hypothetical protein
MKYLIVLLFTAVSALSSNSQHKRTIQITNSKTKNGIPFASVKSTLTKKIVSADKNGFTEIQVGENDTILVSSIGYVDLLVSNAEMKTDSVFELQEYYQDLEVIAVGKYLDLEIKQNDFKEILSLTPNPENQWCIATKITVPTGANKIRLKSVKILIRKTAHKKTNPLRLHLYKADKNGLLLEEELLKKDVVLPEMEINKKYIEFQVDDQNIIIYRNVDSVFYVGVEFLSFSKKEIFDSPGIKITKRSNEQNTVFRDFIIGIPELKSKWVFLSDEDMSLNRSSKAIHPWNMIVTISIAVIN